LNPVFHPLTRPGMPLIAFMTSADDRRRHPNK
jgi:hypothetical protein